MNYKIVFVIGSVTNFNYTQLQFSKQHLYSYKVLYYVVVFI